MNLVIKEKFEGLGGIAQLRIYDNQEAFEKGIVLDSTDWIHNKMTTAGLPIIAKRVGGITATEFTYGELGTSSTAVSSAHTALQAAITDTGLQRLAGTMSNSTTTVTGDTLQFDFAWTASGSKTIEEFGIFNASSAGTMLSRLLTTSKAVSTGQVVTVTYKWIVVGN